MGVTTIGRTPWRVDPSFCALIDADDHVVCLVPLLANETERSRCDRARRIAAAVNGHESFVAGVERILHAFTINRFSGPEQYSISGDDLNQLLDALVLAKRTS